MQRILLAVLFAGTSMASQAEQPTSLAPNATLVLQFPELPNTLAGMVSGKARVAELSAILPSNYSREGKHPLFVYLKGGSGGPEDAGAMAREIIGPEDFLAVSVPLFKKNQPPGKTLPVLIEDLSIISNAYRAMFEKLSEDVPNIDWERSVIGGHSNGAHSLGVLLAGEDDFITSHFHSFWFHEGGFQSLAGSAGWEKRLQESRLLVLVADHSSGVAGNYGQMVMGQINRIRQRATESKIDFNVVIMRGYGHDVPPEYMRNVRQFARRQLIEDINAAERAEAAKLALPLKTHPDSTSWNNLLVGDLTNMKFPGGTWTFKEGILAATQDQNLWTKAMHGDCVLDLEFKFEPGAESGVFLYNSDENNWRPTSVEIQIRDTEATPSRNQPDAWACGAFFGHQAPMKHAVKPAGEWNRMTITAQGPRITVVLNSEVVNEIDLRQWSDGSKNPDGTEVPKPMQGKPWSELPKRGRIGLQGRHASAGIEFRNLKLLRLP